MRYAPEQSTHRLQLSGCANGNANATKIIGPDSFKALS
jgi:hypothetical protein